MSEQIPPLTPEQQDPSLGHLIHEGIRHPARQLLRAIGHIGSRGQVEVNDNSGNQAVEKSVGIDPYSDESLPVRERYKFAQAERGGVDSTLSGELARYTHKGHLDVVAARAAFAAALAKATHGDERYDLHAHPLDYEAAERVVHALRTGNLLQQEVQEGKRVYHTVDHAKIAENGEAILLVLQALAPGHQRRNDAYQILRSFMPEAELSALANNGTGLAGPTASQQKAESVARKELERLRQADIKAAEAAANEERARVIARDEAMLREAKQQTSNTEAMAAAAQKTAKHAESGAAATAEILNATTATRDHTERVGNTTAALRGDINRLTGTVAWQNRFIRNRMKRAARARANQQADDQPEEKHAPENPPRASVRVTPEDPAPSDGSAHDTASAQNGDVVDAAGVKFTDATPSQPSPNEQGPDAQLAMLRLPSPAQKPSDPAHPHAENV